MTTHSNQMFQMGKSTGAAPTQASVKASENVYYAKLINFDRSKRAAGMRAAGPEVMSSFKPPADEFARTPETRDENEYSDICEYDEPKYFEIGRFHSGSAATNGGHERSLNATITAPASASMALKSSSTTLISPDASSRLSSIKSVEAPNNRTSSAASTFSDSSSISSSSFSKISSPCLTEQIYETLSKKLSDFKLNMPPYSTATTTTTTSTAANTTSSASTLKRSTPSHVPYQSATLLVKKSPGDAKFANQTSESKPVQYSLITTQITSGSTSAASAKPSLTHFRSAQSIQSGSSQNYLVKQQQIDFDIASESSKRDLMLLLKTTTGSSSLSTKSTSSSSSSPLSLLSSASSSSSSKLCNVAKAECTHLTPISQTATAVPGARHSEPSTPCTKSTPTSSITTTTITVKPVAQNDEEEDEDEDHELRPKRSSKLSRHSQKSLISSRNSAAAVAAKISSQAADGTSANSSHSTLLNSSSSIHSRMRNSSGHRSSNHSNRAHAHHHHHYRNSNSGGHHAKPKQIKSASTSYLLSKITSIASMTMNHSSHKHAASSHHHQHQHGSSAQTPVAAGFNSSTLMSNLATKTTKLFQRKQPTQQQQQPLSPDLFAANLSGATQNQSASNSYLLSTSTNSIESPVNSSSHRLPMQYSSHAAVHPASYLSSSSATSPLTFSLEQTKTAEQQRPKSGPLNSSSAFVSSSSNLANTLTSRRPFKKRSQTSCPDPDAKLWYYNQIDDYWLPMSAVPTLTPLARNKIDPNLTPTSKLMRSINIKKPSTSSTTSLSSFAAASSPSSSPHLAAGAGCNSTSTSICIEPNGGGCAGPASPGLRLRLGNIVIKHLTLVELKYLKQICFNKLKSEFENGLSSQIRLAIPKDESMKCIKAKNISSRSKSVDFKFFDELKENYFSKKGGKDSAEQVFGQTLYKCIINDLHQSSLSKMAGNKNGSSSAKEKPAKPVKINKNNLIIASKCDMNSRFNGANTLNLRCMNNLSNQQTPATAEDDANPTEFFSKRNSVLFEALDLKNVKFNAAAKPLASHKKSTSRLDQVNENEENECGGEEGRARSTSRSSLAAKQAILSSQNLSIRSEGLVPNIVKSCCKHISEHGLDVVGIFRIDSSKKRIKEIKEMFDTGKQVQLDENFNANDVACILKEYLRSLPEPLLTCDLYNAFLATCKIAEPSKRLELVRHLICLLPAPNRDTLQVLLKLLDRVRAFATPVESSPAAGSQQQPVIMGGNKMDAFNLAMVFGPNLLKRHKLAQVQSNNKLNDMVDKQNMIDDIDSVIGVTKYLIENQNAIFYIEAELHNELMQTINNLIPNEVDAILNRKLVSSVGVRLLDNVGNCSDTSGYSSSVKSTASANGASLMNHAGLFMNHSTTTVDCGGNTLTLSKARPNTDDSSSPSYSSSTNELDRLLQNAQIGARPLDSMMTGATAAANQYMNADFIDNNPDNYRTSRTKLHKINTSNFNYTSSSRLAQPISFINSPSHSPTMVPRMSTKSSSSSASSNSSTSSSASSYKYQPKKQYSHDSNDAAAAKSQQLNNCMIVSSSSSGQQQHHLLSSSALLLMIQKQNKQEQQQHMKALNNIKMQQAFISKATKSLTSLNNAIIQNDSDESDSQQEATLNQRQYRAAEMESSMQPGLSYRRQSGPFHVQCANNASMNSSSSSQYQQYAMASSSQTKSSSNASTAAASCSKYQYDANKSKFNVIGEQETLV